MPSKNKRINLTVAPDLYERIVKYKNENGLLNDTSACLSLIIKQLDGMDKAKVYFDALSKMSDDELHQIATNGVDVLKEINKNNKN